MHSSSTMVSAADAGTFTTPICACNCRCLADSSACAESDVVSSSYCCDNSTAKI